jgi:hypothetical protein
LHGFWLKLPLVRSLPPLIRGMVVFGLFQSLLSGAFVFFLHRSSPDPDPAFFGVLAGVGASVFLAFIVEMSAVVLWTSRYDTEDDLLNGESAALGVCGFLGVGFAVALANHSHAHNLNWVEAYGYAWSVVSLGMLGLLVAAYPLMIYERNRP